MRLIHQLAHLLEARAGSCQLHEKTHTLILLHCVASARSHSIRYLRSYLSKRVDMRLAVLQILSAGERLRQALFVVGAEQRRLYISQIAIPARVDPARDL